MSVDWSALWHLGGHGLYVWPGYGAAALLALAEGVAILRRLREPPGRDAA